MLSDFRQNFHPQTCIYLISQFLIKEILYKSSWFHVETHIWRVTRTAINIESALRKNDFIHQKMWFKYDCMIWEYPPMLHKISEEFIGFIKSGYNVQKPMWMHRFSWKLRAFWWFSLSELYKGKSQQPTRLPQGRLLVSDPHLENDYCSVHPSRAYEKNVIFVEDYSIGGIS